MSDSDVIVTLCGKTDLGRTREHNEDAFLVADLTTGKSSLNASSSWRSNRSAWTGRGSRS